MKAERGIDPALAQDAAAGGTAGSAGAVAARTRAARAAVVAVVVLALAAVTTVVLRQTSDPVMIAYWSTGSAVLTLCLLAFVVGRRHTDNEIAPGRVLCILPAYNEDAESLAGTVRALLRQTVPVDVVVMDDGSRDPVVPSVIHPRVTWLRQENTGKRGAQVAVLRRFDRDAYRFVLTVDSDSEPYPDACEHLLRAMSDERVQAATGMIYVRNHGASWVSAAADIDIGTSCVTMRASRSFLGALETTSGALALYRSELLYDHLEAYAVECGTGDDRWLALRALRRGQVVGVEEARVETDMPTTLRGTYRQRLRWARSWWWMLPYVFSHLTLRQLVSPFYGLTQLLVTPMILLSILLATVASTTRYTEHLGALAVYLGAYVVVRYGISALYLLGRPTMTRRAKLRAWLLGTPAAVVLNLLLLMPTRYVALFRLFDNRWRTRELPARGASVPGGAEAGLVARAS
jgi:hyaluronan synthase